MSNACDRSAQEAPHARLQERGLVRTDVLADVVLRDWTIVISGIVGQQLANAPQQAFDEGAFTAALPAIVSRFARHYETPAPAAKKGGNRRAYTR